MAGGESLRLTRSDGEQDQYERLDQEDSKPRRCPKVLLAFIILYVVILIVFIIVAVLMRRRSARPHVIFIVADDLGWGDVSWEDPDMHTPALEALLADGVRINYSYVHPLDGPSRAAIFTGMYPFHMGLQHETFDADCPVHVPSNVTLLPEHMKEMGYETHLVGKWHLGFCNDKYTPPQRGFDSFFGFYTDDLDYYTHKDKHGYFDFRHNKNVAQNIDGLYSTTLLTEWAVDVVINHDVATPLFLVLAFQSVHAPIQVPQEYVNSTCGHIQDGDRQKMCGMVAAMDQGVSDVIQALTDKGMLDDAVIIFTSDNGGVTAHGSSNHPLKGDHGELYEGGTRVPTLISSKGLMSVRGYTFAGLFHQVDWLPTIASMAGVFPAYTVGRTDGFDQWQALRAGGPSPRQELVYNVDDVVNNQFHTGVVRVGDWKLIHGPTDMSRHLHVNTTYSQLYHLTSDPNETENLAGQNADTVQELLDKVKAARRTMVPAVHAPPDHASNPDNFNGAWSPGWC